MKSSLKQTLSLLAIGLLAIGAQAATLFQDNFESYTTGGLTNQTSVWLAHSGAAPINIVADPTGNSSYALQVSQPLAQDVHANIDTNKAYADITITNLVGPFTTNIVTGPGGYTNIYAASTNYSYAFSPSNSVAALYCGFTIYVTTAPTGAGQYFAHFYTASGGFVARLFIVTNGVTPGSGNYRVAIQNAGTAVTNTIPVDLTPNTAYTLVSRYILSSGTSKIWISPANETSGNNATPLDNAGSGNVMAYAFRQATAATGGTVDVDNLVVGTKFADVVPGSVNPPSIVTQPQDTNVFTGSSAVFSTLALGDDTIGYQWFTITNSVTNGIAGATGKSVTLTSLTTNQSGSIFCVATNGSGTNTTRLAVLLVSAQPIPPTIDTNIIPAITTNTIGDTVVFTVVAHGLPAPAYQWKVVPSTNTLVTNNVAGGTSATLTLANLTTNQAGSYFVTITNSAGYLTTNSARATLTVIPPPPVSIATLRGMVDPVTFAPTNTVSLFTATGIVTTWTNLSSGGCEFFIQDNSGGICVYWNGAAVSNLPPFGAQVKVTGTLSAFNNMLELVAYYTNSLQSVTTLSTGNQPIAYVLPFDPNVQTSLATMQKLEGNYFVASNVTLTAGATFVSASLGEPITANGSKIAAYTTTAMTLNFTNLAGETAVFYVNSYTDIPGQAKPSGPVTVYGVMGNYKNTFEFIPSRLADIISYVHLTNVLANARKSDLATNNYTELVVRPGESLRAYVSIGDAAGGNVTLTPTGTLLTGASWSGITSGSTATAVFQYTGNSLDAGNSFPIQLDVTSTAGTAYTESFNVYVPTPQEQKIAINEILTTPTTNPASAFYNPLARASAVNGISTNDQYVEIVNQSDADLTSQFTLDTGIAASPVFSSFDGFGTSLQSSNSLVVYGGNGNPSVTPGLSTPVFASRGLFLPTTGSGVLVLRNSSGYIIDRVVYAGDATTNGSQSRFPTWTSAFVPQAYISTNLATAGLQYDGGSWSAPSKIPAGVTGVSMTYVNGNAVLHFPANTTQTSTLWSAGSVTGPFNVIYGQPFPSGAGAFTNVNSAAQQFYFITTQ